MGKYEEALERAKEIKSKILSSHLSTESCKALSEYIDTIIPELRESESEDERIRNRIISYLKQDIEEYPERKERIDEMLAYLEKQKEQSFTHHEIDESLRDAVTHQMEDDGDVDDFVRRGIDDIVLKYAELGAQWQKEQKSVTRENDFVSKPQTSVEILRHYLVWAGNSEEEDCPYTWKELADAIRDGIKALEVQESAEWSEEDETCLEYALWCVTKTRLFAAKDVCDLDACRCAERWLKALCDRFALSHWKPSKEQMEVFLKAVPVNLMPEELSVYKSLCNDIQKLM